MRARLVGAAAAAVVLALWALGPIPQDPEYHAMADTRPALGIPNGLDVLSNVFFAIAGLAGLAAVFRRSPRFDDPWTRWPYATLFGGAVLTAAGSSWYHLAPDNARLVWDRVPMTVAFAGLATAVLAERVAAPLARRAFVPLLVFGVASVGYWHWTELRGAGDLRPYVVAQFGSLLLIVVVLARRPGPRPDARSLGAGLLAYALAKVLEQLDAAVLAATGAVSGHTLKHVVAAAGIGCVAAEIARRPQEPARAPVQDPPP
jgi:hypothetical protein